jgi:hypothetical protein
MVLWMWFYSTHLEKRSKQAHRLGYVRRLRVGEASLRECHKVVRHASALVLVYLARSEEKKCGKAFDVEASADITCRSDVDLRHIYLSI